MFGDINPVNFDTDGAVIPEIYKEIKFPDDTGEGTKNENYRY